MTDNIGLLDIFDKAHVVCLSETWHRPCETMPQVPGFVAFAVARCVQPGATGGGRHSGGIAAYVRHELSGNVTEWKKGCHDLYLWLRIDRGDLPDLFICVIYAGPKGTQYADETLLLRILGKPRV